MNTTVKNDISYEKEIIYKESINAEDLKSLLDRKFSAIRIANYYSNELCDKISELLTESEHYGKYINAPKIGRVGQAFFECQTSEKSKKRYAENSVKWLQEIRKGCDPYLTPIDKLRLELDENWPLGSKLGIISGKKMFAGLARHFSEGSEAEPHTDVLSWDAPDEPDAQMLYGQLAVNTYLSMPVKGGELCLWDIWPDKNEYERLRNPGSYGLRRQELGEPHHVIRPQKGELIIFHPERVHSVEPIIDGSRITWSSFIGYESESKPLIIWS